MSQEASDLHYIHGGSVTYGPYRISQRHHEWKGEGSKYWQDKVVVRKSGRIVKVVEGADSGFFRNWASFALFSFVGPKSKQLVITTMRGMVDGADYHNMIYEFGKSLRLLYDSGWYGDDLTQEVKVNDKPDGNGRYGFSTEIGAFEVFGPKPHFYPRAGRPTIWIRFEYDSQRRRFEPVVDPACSGDPKDIGDALLDFKDEFGETDFSKFDDEGGDYLTRVVANVAPFLYEGREDLAWKLFDQEYKMADKEAVRAEMERTLAASKVYQEVLRFVKKRDAHCKKEAETSPSSARTRSKRGI